MNLGTSDIAHLLLAMAMLLSASHGCGYLFRRWRQPPVIGEILGGLLLGPTGFGLLLPSWQRWVFSSNAATQTVLGSIYQMGLLLLMFCSGSEIRSAFRGGEKKTVGMITLMGTIIPFVAGLVFLRLIESKQLMGSAQNAEAFLLVFAIAIAVTSIPVISRILLDLKIMETAFARIVLTVAVLEDIILYIILSIALSMAGVGNGAGFGLPRLLGIAGPSHVGLAYYALATLAFFVASLWIGPRFYRRIDAFRLNLLQRGNPVAHLVVFMLAMTWIVLFLGVPAMFGAFVAGIVASASMDGPNASRETVRNFSFAFFIPIYFAIVGLKLDLIRAFDPLFFVLFLTFACAAKASSVYLGGRLAGESHPGALNLAVAMNARGGPGIVLASLAYDAKIINEGFYVVLVMLAIVTSLLSGAWLDLVLRKSWPLR